MKRRRSIAYYGKRVKRRKPPVTRRVSKGSPAAKAQDRRLVQLVIAGVIFVLLAVFKLLAPESITVFAENVHRSLSQDANFKAAFSAVGEAIAGEQPVGDSLQEAYTAVFAPAEYHAERAAAVYAAAQAVDLPAQRLLSHLSRNDAESVNVAAETAAEGTVPDRSLIYFGAAAPANVSFEQVALGFSYSTPTGGTMTSCFGYRDHPIDGDNRFHYGLDIAAPRGTEICAFADGTVKATGESSSLGKYLMLSHSGGFTTLYAHCDRVTVSSGQQVTMGEKIAEMGDSGVATGTHLHFELLEGDTYLNPIYYVEVY